MKILDATCGVKRIWYQKNHPFVTFMDKRKETLKESRIGRKEVYRINPNVICDWKSTPFKTNEFDMIVFDPPHIIKKKETKLMNMEKYYGRLYKHNWKSEIKSGFKELFRVLKSDGIFILKWCETDIKLKEILKLCPYKPLFGTKTGQANKTHWVLFIKHKLERELNIN